MVAAPLLVLWLFESAITAWLNQPPREERQHLNGPQRQFLQRDGAAHMALLLEYGGAEHNYLVPDNVEEHELFEAARVSPTNFGLLLNARQAAHTFGYLTAPEFVDAEPQQPRYLRPHGEAQRPHLQLVRHAHAGADSAARDLVGGQRQPGGIVLHPALGRRGDAAAAVAGHAAVARHPRSACIAGYAGRRCRRSCRRPRQDDELRPWIDWCYAAQLSPAFDRVRESDGQALPADRQDSHGGASGGWPSCCAASTRCARWCTTTGHGWTVSICRWNRCSRMTGTVAIARGVAYIDELDGRLQRAWSGKAVDQAEIYLIEKLRALLPMARERQARHDGTPDTADVSRREVRRTDGFRMAH